MPWLTVGPSVLHGGPRVSLLVSWDLQAGPCQHYLVTVTNGRVSDRGDGDRGCRWQLGARAELLQGGVMDRGQEAVMGVGGTGAPRQLGGCPPSWRCLVTPAAPWLWPWDHSRMPLAHRGIPACRGQWLGVEGTPWGQPCQWVGSCEMEYVMCAGMCSVM